MSNDKRDVLAVLKAELAFVQQGGYRNAARSGWRPHFIFEDSPACLNSNAAQQRKPCTECLLAQFVPADLQRRNVACRYIPLNEQGETVDSLYRSGTQEETEAALEHWLRTSIQRLEASRLAQLPDDVEIHVRACKTQVE